MIITLALPWGDHDAGDTVDVPDTDARRLIRNGWARKATNAVPQLLEDEAQPETAHPLTQPAEAGTTREERTNYDPER